MLQLSIFGGLQSFLGGTPAPLVVSDNFNRADGGLGANWITLTSSDAPQIVNNEVSQTSVAVAAAFWSANSFNDDQFASVTIGTTTSTGFTGAVRMSASADTMYFGAAGDFIQLYKVIAGGYTQLGAVFTPVLSGDMLRLTANGTTVSLTLNGIEIINVTDSDIASGSAGFFCEGDNVHAATLDDWQGGNLA